MNIRLNIPESNEYSLVFPKRNLTRCYSRPKLNASGVVMTRLPSFRYHTTTLDEIVACFLSSPRFHLKSLFSVSPAYIISGRGADTRVGRRRR